MKNNPQSAFEEIVSSILAGRSKEGLSAARAKTVLAYLQANPGSLLDICALARLTLVQGGNTAPKPFTCGIINAKSGRCAEDCRFCGQSAHYSTGVPEYPLVSGETLLRRACFLAEQGVDYMGIVLSGTGPSARDLENICASVRRIRKETGVKLCASLGLLGLEQALMLKEAGLTSLHHNLETSRAFYPELCSTHGIELREQTVKNAKAAGLRVCCCGIFGVGESWEHRLELSEMLRELEVDSIPINFLRPHPGTPLEHAPKLPPREALSIVALFRLMHPGRDLLICGGRAYNLGRWENMIFSAGANGVMVGDYLICKNNPLEQDLDMLAVLGFRHA